MRSRGLAYFLGVVLVGVLGVLTFSSKNERNTVQGSDEIREDPKIELHLGKGYELMEGYREWPAWSDGTIADKIFEENPILAQIHLPGGKEISTPARSLTAAQADGRVYSIVLTYPLELVPYQGALKAAEELVREVGAQDSPEIRQRLLEWTRESGEIPSIELAGGMKLFRQVRKRASADLPGDVLFTIGVYSHSSGEGWFTEARFYLPEADKPVSVTEESRRPHS